MSSELRVLPCTYDAAKFAVTSWHYSERMPSGKLAKYGVWDSKRFWGVVIFGRGATPNIGKPFGLPQTECVELVRVALDVGHPFFTSQAVAAALKALAADSPGLRLVVSYADIAENHKGGIYQAGNWIYVGKGALRSGGQMKIHGKTIHARSIVNKYGTSSVDWIREHVDPNVELAPPSAKHKYVFPLDRAMRRQVNRMARPYPATA